MQEVICEASSSRMSFLTFCILVCSVRSRLLSWHSKFSNHPCNWNSSQGALINCKVRPEPKTQDKVADLIFYVVLDHVHWLDVGLSYMFGEKVLLSLLKPYISIYWKFHCWQNCLKFWAQIFLWCVAISLHELPDPKSPILRID